MAKPSPIAIAPRDGTLIRLRCRSEAAEPLIGYWSRAFIGSVGDQVRVRVAGRKVPGAGVFRPVE